MAGERGRVFTGARARLSIEGTKVGYATNVRIREEIQYDPVEVLDNIEIEEHVPVRYRVTLSFGFVRIVGETLKTLGYFPLHGNQANQLLQNILTSGELSVAVEDPRTSTILALIEGVRFASQDLNIDARGLVAVNVDAVAISVKDESET